MQSRITGTALVAAIAHTRLLPVFQRLPLGHLSDNAKAAGIRAFNDAGPVFGALARTIEPERSAFSGSAVFIKPELEELLFAVDLDEAALRACDDDHVRPHIMALERRELRVRDCSLLIFFDGFLSIAMTLEMAQGWDNDGIERQFSPQNRDEVAREYMAAMTGIVRLLHAPVRCALHRMAKVAAIPKSAAFQTVPPDSIAIRDSHLLFGGLLNEGFDARAPLDDRYRRLVYAESVAPLANQSPTRDEFIRLDFAFDLLGVRSEVALPARVRELALLVRLQQFIYYHLAAIATETEKLLRAPQNLNLGRLYDIWTEVRNSHSKFIAPTFTYRHEFLVLSQCLYRAWFVERLLDRVDTLLTDLTGHIEREENNRRRRFEWTVQYILVAIAGMSLISALSGLNAFSWFH